MKLDNNQESYKRSCEASFNEGNFCPWRHEYLMDVLFKNIRNSFDESNNMMILDACCGNGRLLHFMLLEFPNRIYKGIDYSAINRCLGKRGCYMKLIHKILNYIYRVALLRDINSIEYWENNLDLMLEHYVSKKNEYEHKT
ncbi:MAG: class I SAM-dependent methyltransferase [Holosporaceae bacterium]|jgi:hypothetical protein|nr:class I SAM-dependent methyltransferase [Holosporaceae bacterium]